MNSELLNRVAQKMVSPNKGILASDERSLTKKFDPLGIQDTEENRRRYRELFITSPFLENYINGIILSEETFDQKDSDGKLFRDILKEKGIMVGVKVDGGTEELNETEKYTKGLEELQQKLPEMYRKGANFVKWRCVFNVSDTTPSEEALERNLTDLAQYALISQQNNLVPIVEPEVLMDGSHNIERSAEVHMVVLKRFFKILQETGVELEGLILKTSMVHPGKESGSKETNEKIAGETVEVLKACVPAQVGGVVFLSGGQDAEEAALNLNEIAELEPLPWEITFSYLRAIEQPALEIWLGKDENIEKARVIFEEMLIRETEADRGELQ